MRSSNYAIMLGLIVCVLSTAHSIKSIYENDTIDNQNIQNFIVIPLGSHCGPAWWMRECNLRFSAYPFDWCITPYRALYEIIKNDFRDYLKKENLVPSRQEYWSEYLRDFYKKIYHSDVDGSSGAVLDKNFQMIFSHDFSNHNFDTINESYVIQYAKYSRRIKRFFEAMSSGKHIYFLRVHDITKREAVELYQLLKSKFPETSFTLIVLGADAEEFSDDWKIPHIKNFFVSESTINLMSLGEVFWEKFSKDLVAGFFL